MPGRRGRSAVPATLAVCAALLAGCGGSGTTSGAGGPTAGGSSSPSSSGSSDGPGSTSAAAPSASESLPASEPGGVEITTGASDFGPMLFDGRGQAIYLFDKERTSEAECYGACAKAWPPVLTDGLPQAQGKARQPLLGTTTRTDGATQVTYAGHPLYYYAHEGPGQVLCHDVREFGGLWLVVTPQGTPAD